MSQRTSPLLLPVPLGPAETQYVRLAEVCRPCSGFGTVFTPEGDEMDCPACQGRALIATNAGLAVLELVRAFEGEPDA